MSDLLRSLFKMKLSNSVVSGDEENQIKINFLLPLVFFTLLFVILSAILALISQAYSIMVAFLISAVILFTALELLRNGTFKLPAVLFVVQGYLFLSFLLLFQGSQAALISMGVVFYLLSSGFLFGSKALLPVIAYSYLVVFASLKEIIPPILSAPGIPEWYTNWVSPFFLIGLFGLLAFLNYRAIQQALQIATSANQERYQIENEEKKFETIAKNSLCSLLITDTDGNIEYVNERFTEWMGYSLEEVRGKNPRIFKSEFTPLEFYPYLWKMITTGETWVGELVNRCKDDSIIYLATKIEPFTDQISGQIHSVAYQEDITQRKKLEYELGESNRQHQEQVEKLNQQEKHYQELLQHDHLTGLYHRDYLYKILPREILRATRARKHLILLTIDVDHFKTFNQEYGYLAGNCVLKEIAKRITEIVGPFDLVFRSVEDEFVVLFSVNTGEIGMQQAQSIQEALTTQPYECETQSINLIVSMGIAIYPIHGNTIDELMNKAENAVSRSKKTVDNGIFLWSPEG